MIEEILDAEIVCQGQQVTRTSQELILLKNCYKTIIQLLHKTTYFFGLFEKLSIINNIELNSLALKKFLFTALNH